MLVSNNLMVVCRWATDAFRLDRIRNKKTDLGSKNRPCWLSVTKETPTHHCMGIFRTLFSSFFGWFLLGLLRLLNQNRLRSLYYLGCNIKHRFDIRILHFLPPIDFEASQIMRSTTLTIFDKSFGFIRITPSCR